mmetsp:Transcript_62861/g.175738  ORF Transcript_62861/g.175738 Transcript_62861/m.175738 type:complete len:399 (-) Transcript_62861:68-1264(-)
MELAPPVAAWAWPAASWAQEGAQSFLDFCESWVGSAGSYCAGARQSTGGPLAVAWDICMPPYQATAVDVLEERRWNLGLTLLGQLTVVTCRLVTGHVGAAVVGLCVFVVGNRARCSLHSGSLTAYVVLGGGFAATDTLSLLQELLSYGTSFVAFPVGDHVVRDLSALSMVLAPVVEGLGANIAWNSYLDPTMLFTTSPCGVGAVARGPATMTIQARIAEMQRVHMPMSYAGGYRGHHGPPVGVHGHYYHPLAYHHYGGIQEEPHDAPATRAEASRPWSWLPWASARSSDAGNVAMPQYATASRASSDAGSNWGLRSPETFGAHHKEAFGAHHNHGASSRDAPYGRLSSAASDLCSEPDGCCCAQCGDEVLGRGSRGSGSYSNQVYCDSCWRSWSTGWR